MPTIKIRSYKHYPLIHIGDTVIVDDPDHRDIYQHSFVGTIVAIGRTLAMVKDQDGNVYDINRDKIHKIK